MEETTTVDDGQPGPAKPILSVTEDSHALIETMTERLGLWSSPTDAALFLASLALARGQDPVPEDELPEARIELGDLDGTTADVEPGPLLPLIGLLRNPDPPLETLRPAQMTGLVAAGTELLAPHLEGADAAEATGALVELLDEIG